MKTFPDSPFHFLPAAGSPLIRPFFQTLPLHPSEGLLSPTPCFSPLPLWLPVAAFSSAGFSLPSRIEKGRREGDGNVRSPGVGTQRGRLQFRALCGRGRYRHLSGDPAPGSWMPRVPGRAGGEGRQVCGVLVGAGQPLGLHPRSSGTAQARRTRTGALSRRTWRASLRLPGGRSGWICLCRTPPPPPPSCAGAQLWGLHAADHGGRRTEGAGGKPHRPGAPWHFRRASWPWCSGNQQPRRERAGNADCWAPLRPLELESVF